jgi:hypothetical protein
MESRVAEGTGTRVPGEGGGIGLAQGTEKAVSGRPKRLRAKNNLERDSRCAPRPQTGP